MGRQYVYFAAEDDEAAADLMLSGTWPAPTFPNEDIRLDELDDLERMLTGRSLREIMADPRFGADIATQINEHAGVPECGIEAVTDTFTRALAAADLSTLPRAYYDRTDALRKLAVVARHAVARGHQMYGFWWY